MTDQLTLTCSFAIEPDDLEAAAPKRLISGIAAPWDTVTTDSRGTQFMLLKGALPTDGPAPKLVMHHDVTQPVGVVTDRQVTDAGMQFTARISATALGNEALTLAADGVFDAVSIGATPIDYVWQDGVMVVAKAAWNELSMVTFGAFAEAKITQVAASLEANEPEPQEPQPESETPVEDTIATSPLILSASPVQSLSPAEYLAAAAAGNYDRISAAAAQQGTSDTPGVLPDSYVGTVYNNLRNYRPFLTAIGVLGMPQNGAAFNRRKITQHVAIGTQAAQFDELTSQKMTISKITVNKTTVGGYVDLSEQEVDWTDPSALNIVLDDLARVYAKQTETLACSNLVSGATVTHNIVDFADGNEVLDALYDGAATINAAIDELPTHLFVSADMWATLGKSRRGTAGERLFENVGPMNAAGVMNPGSFQISGLGLNVVVSPRFAAATCILGNLVGFEAYEQNKGSIRVDQPATLSTRLAWRGYFATAVIDANAFLKFT